MESSNAYVIELVRWGISNDGTNPSNTTTGINNAIVWATQQGYDYIKLPSGTYTIAKGASKGDKSSSATLQVLSNIVLDLTGCTLQKETNSYPTYYTIYGYNIENCIIKNGIIKGDRDTHNFSDTSGTHENCIGVFIEGKNRNFSINGTELYNFPGYTISLSGYQYQFALLQYNDIESGTIDSTTGANITNTNFVRTKNSYSIANYQQINDVGSFMITGNGYNSFGARTDGGGINLSNTIFNIHFYNSSGSYVGNIQKRCYDPIPVAQFPASATTFRISFRYDYTKIIPNNFYLGLDARKLMVGTRIENCKIHDSYSIGLTISNSVLTLIENNEFYSFGYSLGTVGRKIYPFPMAIDIEDGYNANQHITIRNNIFRDNESLHLSISQARNVLIEGNKFNGTGGVIFQGTKASNFVSRGNDYNITGGTGQSATYVKFENDHMSASTIQLTYECIYEDCVFDDMVFVVQMDTWGDFAIGTTYTIGTAILPHTTKNGFYYVCTKAAGVAVNTEPNWGTTLGGTTTDAAGNVWTAYVYNPTYDLVEFINCKFRHNIPEGANGFALRRSNILFNNCQFTLNTIIGYFYDLSSMYDFAGKNQYVFKDCSIDISATNTSLGSISGDNVYLQRTKITGASDGNYPVNKLYANNLFIEESLFNSFNVDIAGYKTGTGAVLTIKNSIFNLNKTTRRFGNTNEGFYVRNFDSIVIENNEITLPASTVSLRPFSIFAEKYLKITDNYINSSNPGNNLELWGAYRDSSHTNAIPLTTALIRDNCFSKFVIKTDASYYIQLQKSLGNGFIDLDSPTEGSSTSMSSIPTSGYFYLGQAISNSNPIPGGPIGWVTITAGIANNTTWTGFTAYSANTFIYSGTSVYQALTSGKSSTNTPTFPTSLNGRVDDISGATIWAPNTAYSVGAMVIPKLEVSDPTGTSPTLKLIPNTNSTLTPTRYYVRFTWVTATGETKGSNEAYIDVTAGNNLSISVPAFPSGAAKANIYVSTVANQERYQGSINSSGLSFIISAPINIAIVPTQSILYPLTSGTGYWYECTASTGKSGATAPTWSKNSGATIKDGGVTWTVRGIVTWKNVAVKAMFQEYGVISS